MKEFRCPFCQKKLGEEEIVVGIMSTKCPRCGNITIIQRQMQTRGPTKIAVKI